MLENLIYLDNNATTPVDDQVIDAMLPFLRDNFANAASFSHVAGRLAADAVEAAREQIAKVVGAESKDIIFTSGATESINLALTGYVEFNLSEGSSVLTSTTEHEAVLDTLRHLEPNIFVDYLPVDRKGILNMSRLAKILELNTVKLLSLQHANNETGVVHDIQAIGQLAHETATAFHVDAAQTFGKLPINVETMKIDLMSISAHKIHGPKGVGALYIRRKNPRIRLQKQMHGGLQEREYRPGSLNVPGIVGFGKAAEMAYEKMSKNKSKVDKLTSLMKGLISENIPQLSWNGAAGEGLPGNLNFSIDGIDARQLLCELPELCLSTGSACISALNEPSHVLKAMGLTGEQAMGTLRIGLSRFNTEAEIKRAVELLASKVFDIRQKLMKESTL
jgi:cysteine desulfurase